MIDTFLMVSTYSITMQSSNYARRLVCLCVGDIVNKYCVMVCGSISMFSVFSEVIAHSEALEFLYSSLGGATIFAKLWSKIAKL